MISLHIRASIDPTKISEAQHAYTKGGKQHREITQHQRIEGAFNNVPSPAITEYLTGR